MNSILHIYSPPDLIEVKVKGTLIFSITRFVGTAQSPRQIKFDDLTPKEKLDVVEAFKKKHLNGDEDE